MSKLMRDDEPICEAADDDGLILFEVSVLQSIGAVRRGSGKFTPLEAAYALIARHQLTAEDHAEYRFPGPHVNSVTTVTVATTGG